MENGLQHVNSSLTVFHMEWETLSVALCFPEEGSEELGLPAWWVPI